LIAFPSGKTKLATIRGNRAQRRLNRMLSSPPRFMHSTRCLSHRCNVATGRRNH
jgi:hypothetical protein